MSLTICPECAHEVSSSAAACPNCGHPFVRPPVAPPKVIVRELPPEKEGFPTWAFIPLGLLGLVLLFVLFVFMRNGNNDDAQRNLNVRVATQPPVNTSRETTTTTVRPDAPPTQVTLPPATTLTTVVAPPVSSQTTTTTIPAPETVAPDKSVVSLEAKVVGRTGSPQPVQKEVFYLLDKDLESILNDANIEDESGQGLVNAFGLSIVYPDRYDDVRKKALAAIGKHSKYRVTTDATGKAQMKDVKPDNYYLFAITKTADGFAIWKNQVTIQPGQNALVLEPVSPTKITQE